MRRWLWGLGAASLLAVAIQCGSSGEADEGSGVDAGNGECGPGRACQSGFVCSAEGRCEASSLPGIATPPSRDDAGDQNGDGGLVPTDVLCADISVDLTRLVPKVLFLLDQSSSMLYEKFPNGDSNGCANGCRWTELKRVLIGPDDNRGGLIKQLESEAEIAVEMYSATDPNPNDDDNSFLDASAIQVQSTCPRFNGRAFDGLTFSKQSFSDVDSLLRPATVDDDTPTGPAIRAAIGLTPDGGTVDGGLASVISTTPKILVLVTDGEPMLCGENSPSDNGRAAVVDAVKDTYKQDIRTFVIAIGSPSAHFDQVARAGQGLDVNNGDASAVRPDTTEQLVSSLRQIVLAQRTCTFDLNGKVEKGFETLGKVTLNGTPVPFNEPNGWKLVTESRIELTGSFCETLKTQRDADLKAQFPCGAISPLPPKGPNDPK